MDVEFSLLSWSGIVLGNKHLTDSKLEGVQTKLFCDAWYDVPVHDVLHGYPGIWDGSRVNIRGWIVRVPLLPPPSLLRVFCCCPNKVATQACVYGVAQFSGRVGSSRDPPAHMGWNLRTTENEQEQQEE